MIGGDRMWVRIWEENRMERGGGFWVYTRIRRGRYMGMTPISITLE